MSQYKQMKNSTQMWIQDKINKTYLHTNWICMKLKFLRKKKDMFAIKTRINFLIRLVINSSLMSEIIVVRAYNLSFSFITICLNRQKIWNYQKNELGSENWSTSKSFRRPLTEVCRLIPVSASVLMTAFETISVIDFRCALLLLHYNYPYSCIWKV